MLYNDGPLETRLVQARSYSFATYTIHDAGCKLIKLHYMVNVVL